VAGVKSIIINLLVEEELAQAARARDPVKLMIAINTAVLALVVAVGGVFSGMAMRSGVAVKLAEAKLHELEKQQTSGSVGAYLSLKQWTDDLIELNQSRRLCAPQLALLKDLIPDYIQIVRLTLTTVAVVRAPAAPPPEAGQDDVKAKIAARAAPAAQLAVLLLDGKIISTHPEDDLANFRKILESDPLFSAQIQLVKLRSYGRVSGPAERGGPITGQFVFECQFKEPHS
jgi:hypothetical protein